MLLLAVGALLLSTATPAIAAPVSTSVADRPATVVHGDDVRIFTDASGQHHVISASAVSQFVPPATAGDISLRINAIDVDGSLTPAPFVVLVNMDDETLVDTVVRVSDGVGTIDVPAGHYTVMGDFGTYSSDGQPIAEHGVLVNDFTVSDTQHEVTLDARLATSRITVATPRPATQQKLIYGFTRTGLNGRSGMSVVAGNVPVYVNPVGAPAIGGLHYTVQWDGAGSDYRYDLGFATDNQVAADQSFRPDRLATVHLGLYSDTAGPAYLYGTKIDSYSDAFPLFFDFPQAFPAAITQYVSPGTWLQGAETPNGTVLTAPAKTFEAKDYDIDWARGPLVPNLGQYNASGLECYACVAGGNLTFGLNLLGDSVSDHLLRALPAQPTNLHFSLDRDGVRLADEDGVNGVRLGDLPPGPATYRAAMDLDWSGVPGVTTSTSSYTELTVKSSDQDPVLPADDTCAGDAPCRILPALTLGYRLGAGPSAVQTLGLDVGHLSYNGVGSHSPITSVTVEVRFGGGKIWQPALVTGAFGHYLAAWPNRPGSVSLRVTASDAAGDSILQTVNDPYGPTRN